MTNNVFVARVPRPVTSPDDLKRGDRVFHPDYGRGTVTAKRGEVVWIRLEANGLEGTVAWQMLRKMEG